MLARHEEHKISTQFAPFIRFAVEKLGCQLKFHLRLLKDTEIWPGNNVCSQSFVMLIVKVYQAFCLQRQKAERGHNKQMLTTIFSFNSLSCGSNTQVGQAFTKMFSIR